MCGQCLEDGTCDDGCSFPFMLDPYASTHGNSQPYCEVCTHHIDTSLVDTDSVELGVVNMMMLVTQPVRVGTPVINTNEPAT